MDNPETNNSKSAWKGRLLKFIIYLLVGFAAAYIYRQMKN